MKFKDVAHLYIGCKVLVNKSKNIYPFTGLDTLNYDPIKSGLSDIWNEFTYYEVKPILYPLSAMTEEQEGEMLELSGSLNYGWKHDIKVNAIRTKYLLSHHFDLFNMIESGEAIDVTTLDRDPYNC